jgi:hypothetical protein
LAEGRSLSSLAWRVGVLPRASDERKTGRRHGLLAAAAFVGVAGAAQQLPKLLDHDGIDPGIATASGVLALLMLLSFVAMGINRRAEGSYFGLIERG